MYHLARTSLLVVVYMGLVVANSVQVLAKDTIDFAGDKLSVTAPEGWVSRPPATRIVEREFSIPKVQGDSADGRLTVMGAGGSIDANIDRWKGQFETAEGKELGKDAVQVEKRKIGGEEVVIVDISGTFLDKQGGPFAPGPTLKRENYRMLAGIVTTQNLGNYFFKLYGPEKTIAANHDAFIKMLESLERK